MAPSSPTFALSLPSRPESLTVVRHVLGGITGTWPVDEELLDDVRIAVTEACASAITPGTGGPAAGLIEIAGAHEDGRLVMTVRSPGPGLSAPDDDDGDLGLALPLIGALTETVDLGIAEDGRHEVRMVFPETST